MLLTNHLHRQCLGTLESLNPTARLASIPAAQAMLEAEKTSPIFLVGCVRSGTTMLRLMLDHHPEVAFLPEFEFAVDLVDDRGAAPRLDAFHSYLEQHRIFLDHGLAIDRQLDFPGLLGSFLDQKRDRDAKPLVGATVHTNFDRLLHIWPDARFIHLVRDGRDVSRSIVQQGWAGNAYEAAKMWLTAESLWADLAPRIGADRRHEVRYEDLVVRPEETLGSLCKFLGVPYDPAMLSYPQSSTYGAPSPSLSGQWQRMPPGELSTLESRLGEMLARLGYPPSGQPARRPSRTRQAMLHWHHRVRHATFRCRRLGPKLFLTDLIARRLGLRSLQRHLTKDLQAVERRHLR